MPSRPPKENWDDFRYFLAVARTGTLSAAAEQLGTEHTTVARHVQSLERALNSRLFHKSNVGYELTEAGNRLMEAAQGIESALVATRAVAEGGHEIGGTVRIGAPDGFGTYFLAPRIHKLLEKNPRLEIELIAAPRLFSLAKREADIAIGLSSAEHLRVASRRLTEYSMLVYGARGYLKSAPPIRDQRDLAGHPFIGYMEDLLFTPELNFLGVTEVPLHPRLRSSNLVTQVQATLAGRSLCILPAYVAANFSELVPVLADEVRVQATFHMHVHVDHQRAAHVREVARFIADEVDAHRATFLGPAATRKPGTK
ncbi:MULTISPECIES: LysR family transcriptional regulator [unclassified Cupriavidus]|uniref:LysR family transcriptional regulator n=1 Tax=unclassified Cupriavidus TaxID=2640874 RepID=UPI00313BD30B